MVFFDLFPSMWITLAEEMAFAWTKFIFLFLHIQTSGSFLVLHFPYLSLLIPVFHCLHSSFQVVLCCLKYSTSASDEFLEPFPIPHPSCPCGLQSHTGEFSRSVSYQYTAHLCCWSPYSFLEWCSHLGMSIMEFGVWDRGSVVSVRAQQ